MVNKNHHLPFVLGEVVESRSFLAGYRSAWFRCKIIGMKSRKGVPAHILEFFDFPDEKPRFMQLYQVHPFDRFLAPERRKLHLMVRPCFPPIYSESQTTELHKISGVVAIVVDDWKVGDLVDWWCDGCYWSAKVTHLLGNDKVQVELPEPPWGEGKSYEACCKDLRPSLDWSLEEGWTVPVSMDNESSRYCARLIQPLSQEVGGICPLKEKRTGEDFRKSADSCRSADFSSSSSSVGSFLSPLGPSQLSSVNSLKRTISEVNCNEMHPAQRSGSLDQEASEVVEDCSSDRASPSHAKSFLDALYSTTSASSGDQYECGGPSEIISRDREPLSPLHHGDTIESYLVGLEELAAKVRWLKRTLQSGSGCSDSKKPSWKLVGS